MSERRSSGNNKSVSALDLHEETRNLIIGVGLQLSGPVLVSDISIVDEMKENCGLGLLGPADYSISWLLFYTLST